MVHFVSTPLTALRLINREKIIHVVKIINSSGMNQHIPMRLGCVVPKDWGRTHSASRTPEPFIEFHDSPPERNCTCHINQT